MARRSNSAKRASKSDKISKKPPNFEIRAVDLFCGAGGLTLGLENAGINVAMGIDIDPACEYPFEANNKAKFLKKSVEDVSESELADAYGDAKITLLAGCAPCQPFSTYSKGKSDESDERWNLLLQFGRMVNESRPHLVTMENVPMLAHQKVFEKFVQSLEGIGYHVSHQVVNCADYGVPQQRNRLVLLASRLGPIDLIAPTSPSGKHKTVRKAIEKLPKLSAGECDEKDPLHQASELSALNLKRIRVSKPGGTWRDWPEELVAECHKKASGKTYPSVYGRMGWDEPAPTMTTQFFGFGNGRFGHPEQDRAISLREGAIIQSFPKSYKFAPKGVPIRRKTIGRLIGNAVPVKLGEAIGKSFISHLNNLDEAQAIPA
ncbi:DNA cytosine methyltransferase [Hyphococcus lacteus]|uniref:DNA (cytosine-5-)-methyltransferase n=1 Tax=Hyphococcus lacteus TaxID=3143536 RepID=A0ABV3Z6G6_9PROT